MDARFDKPSTAWRPGLRFSLRSLVLLVLFAAVGLGVYSWGLRRARRQAPAVDTLRTFGATVTYDFGGTYSEKLNAPRRPISKPSPYPTWLVDWLGIDFFHDVTEVHCESSIVLSTQDANVFWDAIAQLPRLTHLEASGGMTQPENILQLARHDQLTSLALRFGNSTPSDFAVLQKLPRLARLDLSDAPISDEHLRVIGKSQSLKLLDLHHARITSAGLQAVAEMPQLEHLWLSGTEVGDEGMALLRAHPSLTDLDLGYTAITDPALAHLATIPHLTELDLAATAVTDSGLTSLEGHPKLSYLNLESTEVRGSGLASLKHLPNLEELCLGGRNKLKSAVDLAGCRRLKRLKMGCEFSVIDELQYCDVPERVIETGAGHLMNDGGLTCMIANHKIKSLYFSAWNADMPAKIAEFRAARPDCELVDDRRWPNRGLRSRP
jgi:hypothetical protein